MLAMGGPFFIDLSPSEKLTENRPLQLYKNSESLFSFVTQILKIVQICSVKKNTRSIYSRS